MIVFVAGEKITIKEPSPATLKKYGLALNEWKELLARQGYRCPICTNVLSKTTNIDHFHVRHWSKMTAENRKKYIRGVTCWYDNKNFLAKGITVQKAQKVLDYLERFEARRPR